MHPDPRVLLADVEQAGEAIECFTEGMDQAAYAGDFRTKAAVERKFEIIGEALNILSTSNPELADKVYILHLKGLRVLQGGGSHSMEQTESSDPQVAHVAEHFPVRLADALRDLGEVKDEARDEGFPTPADAACENANRLLKEMCPLSQRRFEVYAMPDGEIAIDASDGQGSSVLLLCDSDGGVLCLVNMGGKHRQARYSSAETLPDDFVREALAELEQQGD